MRMKVLTMALALVFALSYGSGNSARADVLTNFVLDGVKFDDGGTAIGSFTIDTTTDQILNLNVITTVGSKLPGGVLTDSALSIFGLDPNPAFTKMFLSGTPGTNTSDLLFMWVSTSTFSLTNPDPIITFEAFQGGEAVQCGVECFGSRNVVSGSVDPVAAVPELSTWAMMMIGFAGIGFMAYRRSHKSLAA